MGVYLNSKKPYLLFREDRFSTYFIDKTDLFKELIPLLEPELDPMGRGKIIGEKGNKYLCITRPRRFGKTVMANMISANRFSASFMPLLTTGFRDI